VIYLDYNATSPLDSLVEREIKKNLPIFGNPSALYRIGRLAQAKIEDARYALAQWLGASETQVTFAGSGSEANNQVLWSVWLKARPIHTPHFAILSIEHASVRNYARFLESLGAKISWIKVDTYGRLDLNHLEEILKSPTDLVSVMMGNNEVGTIQPIKEVVALAASCGCLVHTDAVQAVGKMAVSFSALGVDFLTFSGHKWGAPKGIGGSIAKTPQTLKPLIYGGGQEKGKRAGTENILGIIGLHAAINSRLKTPYPEAELFQKIEQLYRTLSQKIPNCIRNGHPIDRIANTLNLSILGVEGAAIVMKLDLEGIAISSGSACATGSVDPSEVLLAMDIGEARVKSAIRMSIGPETTDAALDRLGDVLPKACAYLRNEKK